MTSDRDEREQPEAPSRQDAAQMDDMNEQLSIVSSNNEETEEETNDNSDFVNEGYQRWEESRAQWLNISDGSSNSNSTAQPACAVPIEVDEIMDLIFSQRWRNPDAAATTFVQPVPLPQMVDILVDLWEAEGLDV